jgi:osmoprotectant transport system substrate-binding protein
MLLAAAVAITLVAACGGDDDDDDGGATDTTAPAEVPEGPEIVIGAQDFGESAILAQVYGQALEAAGYLVSYQSLGGFRDLVYSSFESGEINFTAEYAASALEFLNENAGEATPDADATTEALRGYLEERGIVAFDPSPAVDSNSFVVTEETAEELDLQTISDLAAVADDLTLGGPPDCETNPFCIPGLQDTYGIDFSDSFTSLDGGGPLTVEALRGGEVDVAILFSTSGVIADEGWVVLDDDKGLINADNVVPVASQEVAEAYGDAFAELVNRVSAAMSTEELTELNKRFDIDKEDADAIAADWLAGEGLA